MVSQRTTRRSINAHGSVGILLVLRTHGADGERRVGGAREAGAEAVVKRVLELVPEEVARKSGFKLDQPAPVATVNELPDSAAIILGVTTRYGRMNSQIANF